MKIKSLSKPVYVGTKSRVYNYIASKLGLTSILSLNGYRF